MSGRDVVKAAATSFDARWLSLRPDTWRTDLLRIVLRVGAVLGAIVSVPSILTAVQSDMLVIAIVDTLAVGLVITLAVFDQIPAKVRAAGVCLLFYVIGTGLLFGVGARGQIYLVAFSLFTTLLLSLRWGLASVVLGAITMLVVGLSGIASPAKLPMWTMTYSGWFVITANFVFVNTCLVLTLGAVITALENALRGTESARLALEHDQRELVNLNHSLALEVSERTNAEQALRDSKALMRIAGVTARIGGWRWALDGSHVKWSDELCELLKVVPGTSPTLEQAIEFFAPEFRSAMRDAVQRCATDGSAYDVQVVIVASDGGRLWVRVIGNAVRADSGDVTHIHGSVQDITPQKRADERHTVLEDQLRQVQKLETIGSLAAGIAHDFNNLLSIVLSYSELLIADLKEHDPMRADLEEIHKAGERSTDLTRQLLAFSRQQVLAPKVVDLSESIRGMENMLRRLIGEDIQLTTTLTPKRSTALVDPGQMEQVILNLAVNARDAMPQGGVLSIETAEILLDADYAELHVGVVPGLHVMLAVSDNGIGMDKATYARMFEPFFTTKGKDKGTGLGLATVFGIVRQSGGTIWAYSEPGRGTTFKLFFPVARKPAEARGTPVSSARITTRGSETILLVEDEGSLRILASSILRKHGYHVLETQNAGEALLICEQFTAPIHLLLTDVVMPLMSGRQLAERLLPLRPSMKVLYMSGYTDDAAVRHGILESTVAFIQKPITPEPLARKVRDVLDDY